MVTVVVWRKSLSSCCSNWQAHTNPLHSTRLHSSNQDSIGVPWSLVMKWNRKSCLCHVGEGPSESTGVAFSREIKSELVRLEIKRRGINSPMKTIGSTRDTSSLMELRGSLRSLLPTFQKPRRETITQHIVSTLFLKPTFENRSGNEQKSYLGVCYHWRVGALFCDIWQYC